MTDPVRRLQILEDLSHYGISGRDANFIELIPLVEMVWADGHCQEGELAVLDQYIAGLVARLNELQPMVRFSIQDAENFALRFLKERPSRDLLTLLRNWAFGLADAPNRKTLLAACLDIAASSVVSYPYDVDERFNPAEKKIFFELLEAENG